MVISLKRQANITNSKKSTGPKSLLGKFKSSQNAIKHGAYSTKHIIAGEDKSLYEAIKIEQKAAFKPASFIETALVDELINQLWTLRRLERAGRYYLTQCKSDVERQASSVLDELASKISPSVVGADSEKSAIEVQRELYEAVYIYDVSGRMERLASQKRVAIQTILSLERELERRLVKRRKKKGGVAVSDGK